MNSAVVAAVSLSDPVVPLTGCLLVLLLAATLTAIAHLGSCHRETRDLSNGDGLEILGLSKSYRGRTVVDDVTLSVRPGTVLCVIGPNGAGKTTLLRMVVGMVRPDSGHVRLFGQTLASGSPVLRRVGCSLEEAGFLPGLSGRRNLEIWWQATGRGPSSAHMETVCAATRLGDALERRAGEYSQGMRRRLSIAIAMLGLPDVLVLDEPTNGLDPDELAHFRSIVRDYARSGRAVVISSHSLAEVDAMSTDIAVIVDGRLRVHRRVAELTESSSFEVRLDDAVGVADALTHPHHPFRVAVVGPRTMIVHGAQLQSAELVALLDGVHADVESLRRLSRLEALYFECSHDR